MSQENTQHKFILTDELREKASKKPDINILFVSDGDSRLKPFRGEVALRNFTEFFHKQANITYMTATSSRLANMTVSDFNGINVLWLDNVTDYRVARNLSEITRQLLSEIDTDWQEKIRNSDKSEEDVVSYIKDISKKREDRLRIIYALDEFIWEAPVGRSHDIQTVQVMETCMNIADNIIVPTVDMKDIIIHLSNEARNNNITPFVVDKEKLITVIPTGMNHEFSPTFKNFSRSSVSLTQMTMAKPKVLVKGIYIPKNVDDFICENRKRMDITICSVDEVSEQLTGLIQSGSVKHIYHWANPYVNAGNMIPTYAIERDAGFDFVIHTLSDNLNGKLYELSCGDEDILFALSYGALPICGYDHLIESDMNEQQVEDIKRSMTAFAGGLTFGKKSTAKDIRNLITSHTVAVKWNESYMKYKPYLDSKSIMFPALMNKYFLTMIGKDLAYAREALANEVKEKIDTEINQEQIDNSKSQDTIELDDIQTVGDIDVEESNNIIPVNFGGGK